MRLFGKKSTTDQSFHWIPDVHQHSEFLIALIGELPLPLMLIFDLAAELPVLPPRPFHWLNPTQDDLVVRVSKSNRIALNDFFWAIDPEESLWHVHIRKGREYLFQADDRFKRGFIRIASSAVDEPWLHDLKKRGIISSYARCKGTVD